MHRRAGINAARTKAKAYRVKACLRRADLWHSRREADSSSLAPRNDKFSLSCHKQKKGETGRGTQVIGSVWHRLQQKSDALANAKSARRFAPTGGDEPRPYKSKAHRPPGKSDGHAERRKHGCGRSFVRTGRPVPPTQRQNRKAPPSQNEHGAPAKAKR